MNKFNAEYFKLGLPAITREGKIMLYRERGSYPKVIVASLLGKSEKGLYTYTRNGCYYADESESSLDLVGMYINEAEVIKQKEIDGIYMQTALLHASRSKANRAKVGACLVTKQGCTLTGYNGTHQGADNACEVQLEDGSIVSKSEVIHAELNCVLKAAREGVSVLHSTLYTSLSPCNLCAAMLVQAGIERVVYLEEYRNVEGLELLRKAGVLVQRFEVEV